MNITAILPTISTFFIIISAIFVALGWIKIKQKNLVAHKKLMKLAAISALFFFIIYMCRTIFIGNTSFGGPAHLKVYYSIFLVFHIFLATIGAVFGIITLWSGFHLKLLRHRKLGPITSIIWFFSAVTGVVVYLLLYVFFQGGETTSLIKAILGL